MNEDLRPRFTEGTHRLCAPEQTLARVAPLLERCGITRIAELTRLDVELGVPTYAAIRPRGSTMQTSAGKGLTAAAAKVSAVMEAIELEHAERPEHARLLRASAAELRARGLEPRRPGRHEADRIFHDGPARVLDWVEGRELISGAQVWLPACAAYFIEPTIYRTTTNGLASGNHLVEASLHALYELLERDAISGLVEAGALVVEGRARVVDAATIEDRQLATIISKIRAADIQLVLLWVPAQAPVHVFWAALLDHRPGRASTALVTGSGAHLDLRVAAARAITEAVQSRLTIVQATRDDLAGRASFSREALGPGPASRFFSELPADASWAELARLGPRSASLAAGLDARLDALLGALADAGHEQVLRVELTRPELGVPVAKLIVPSLRFCRVLF